MSGDRDALREALAEGVKPYYSDDLLDVKAAAAYYSDPWLTVHLGDCREVMASMDPESVHCVVTSPPYWGLRDYGTDGQLGLEPTPEAYVKAMVAVFREVRRVLRSDGTVWLNLGDSYAGSGKGAWSDDESREANRHRVKETYVPTRAESPTAGIVPLGLKPKDLVGIPWRVAFALQADGWYLRSDIIWSKPNPMPESVTDRPTKSHEYVFLLSKSARYWYDADAVREPHTDSTLNRIEYGLKHRHPADVGVGVPPVDTDRMGERFANPAGRNIRSVWTVATQPYPGAHFATFPPKLIEPCIKAGCPDKVCVECGAPWERVVERVVGKDWNAHKRGNERLVYGNGTGVAQDRDRINNPPRTTGWRPTCAHDAATEPGTVLDPFAGSGTTAMVANRLSRRAVLIDLNADYLGQIMDRNRALPLGLESA